MPTTRRQRANNPLGWIDLDPWHSNAPPDVDDQQLVEPPINDQQQGGVPPDVDDHFVVKLPIINQELPDVDNHSVIEPPNNGQPPSQGREEEEPEPLNNGQPTLREEANVPSQRSTPLVGSLSPLTPLTEEMAPDRSTGREQRARSNSLRPLTTSRTQPNVRNAQDERVGASSSTIPLEQRITDAPILLRRMAEPQAVGIESNQKRPEEYRIMKFESDSKLKADGSNYYLWKDLEETILYGNRWYGHVDGTSTSPDRAHEPAKFEVWKQIDNLAKGQLSFNMDSSLYQELRVGARTAADLWKKVNERFGIENTVIQNRNIVELHNK